MGSRAWALVLLSGCGRLGFDPGSAPNTDPPPPPDATAVVCEPHQWTTAAVPLTAAMAASATPNGLVLSWVESSTGSNVSGALLDRNMSLSVVSPVKAGTYISSSFNYVDGTVVSSEVEPGLGIKFDTVGADLQGASEFGCPSASVAPKPGIMKAGADVIGLSGFDNGLTVWPIVNWSQNPSLYGVNTAPVTAMASAQVGTTAAVAWSTATECHLALVTSASTGTDTMKPAPCANIHMATDGATLMAAYEVGGEVAIAVGSSASLDPSVVSRTIASATSPRVVHDGTRYWIAYIDSGSGEVMLGTQNDNGTFTTTSTGHVSASDAYDVGVLDGRVWVAASDTAGLATDHVCLR